MTDPTMDQDSEPTGTIEEVLQDDEPIRPMILPPVRVVVEGSVPVQTLPSRAGASLNRKLLLADGAVCVLSADPRRRIARLIATVAYSVGSDQGTVSQGVAAIWPANLVCEITHAEDIWVSPSADLTISAMVEAWAD